MSYRLNLSGFVKSLDKSVLCVYFRERQGLNGQPFTPGLTGGLYVIHVHNTSDIFLQAQFKTHTNTAPHQSPSLEVLGALALHVSTIHQRLMRSLFPQPNPSFPASIPPLLPMPPPLHPTRSFPREGGADCLERAVRASCHPRDQHVCETIVCESKHHGRF